MLEKNTLNRPINKNNLASLTKELRSGNFHFTGESIKFSKDGTLLDGQHRLLAVLESKVTIEILVIRGLDNDAFKYMDTGRPRLASDVLATEGVTNASKVASMIKLIIAFKQGAHIRKNSKTVGAKKITNAMVSDFMRKHSKSIIDSYGFGFGKGKRIISGTLVATMHYVLKTLSEPEADDFFNKLVEGSNLTKESPISVLRERFIIDARSKHKMHPAEKKALIIKAWNFYRKNKKVSVLRWNMNTEEFPKAI